MSEENKLVKIETKLPRFVEDAYDSIEKMQGFANLLLSSKLVPNHFYEKLPTGNKPDFSKGKTEAVVIVLLLGHQLQLPPLTALQHIIPVNGLLSIKGDLAKTMIFNSGKLMPDSWIEKEEGSIEQENLVVSITATRADNGQCLTRSFSVAQAKRAGLWVTQSMLSSQDGWKYEASAWWKYPARMVNYRALGFLARDLFPDVLNGIYTTEEAYDIPTDQTVVIEQEGGAKIVLPNKNFTQSRSAKITARATEKIREPNFGPVNPGGSPTPPISPQQSEAGAIQPGSPEAGGEDSGGDLRQYPMTTNESFQQESPDTNRLSIAQMTEMETDDLLKIINSDSELSEALMIIPGKNTNKKLRELIFAYQEGFLPKHLKPFIGDGPEAQPPAQPEGSSPEQDPKEVIPPEQGSEVIPPESSDMNKYNLVIPPFNKGNERDFAETKNLYQALTDVSPSIGNERFLELQKKIPAFESFANKEHFCKYATVAEVCVLLNNNN